MTAAGLSLSGSHLSNEKELYCRMKPCVPSQIKLLFCHLDLAFKLYQNIPLPD